MRDNSLFPGTGVQLVRLGAMAWILGTVQFFIFHGIVELAWAEPYSWAQNNISDLGNVGCGAWGDNGRYVCSPWHAWMNLSFVLYGVFLLAGLVLTAPLWGGKLAPRIARALIFLGASGWMIAGFVPADVNENLHVLGALFIFLCGNLGLILIGNPAHASGMRMVRVYSFLLGGIGLVATVLFVSQHYLGLGMGGMERLVVFPGQFWALLTGTYVLRSFAKGNPVQLIAEPNRRGISPK